MKIEKVIHSGQFGSLYLVNHSKYGVAALKTIKKGELKFKFLGKYIILSAHEAHELYVNEVNALRLLDELQYSYFPEYYENWDDAENYYLLQEYVEGTTLRYYRTINKDWMNDIKVVMELADIALSLHEKQIYYLDFNMDNIIIRKNANVTLVDYGLVCGSGLMSCKDSIVVKVLGKKSSDAEMFFLTKILKLLHMLIFELDVKAIDYDRDYIISYYFKTYYSLKTYYSSKFNPDNLNDYLYILDKKDIVKTLVWLRDYHYNIINETQPRFEKVM